MALAPTAERINDSVLFLEGEVTTHGVKEAGFEAGLTAMPLNSVTDGLGHESIGNESMTASALGKQPDGVGVQSASTLGCAGYLLGTGGTGVGDGQTPVPNTFSKILGATNGAAPVTRNGALSTGTSTTTEVEEASGAGNYGVGDILPVVINNRVQASPIINSALGVHTLGLALEEAPATGALLLGSVQFKASERFLYQLQGRHVKRDWGPGQDLTSFRNAEFFGGVVTQLQLAAAARNASQTFSAEMRIDNFVRHIVAAKTDPDVNIPFANNFSRFIIAKKGQTAGLESDFFSVDITINNAVSGSPKRGKSGVGGWIRGAGSVANITCNFSDFAGVPTGFVEQYFDIIYSSRVNNELHCLVQYGDEPGSTVVFYYPSVSIDTDVTPADIEEASAMQIVLATIQDANVTDGLMKAMQC